MKKGAIKVSIFYPSGEGKYFDMEYYANQHVSMVAGLLGDSVIGATVERGLAGGAPGERSPFEAMGNLYFESMESFQNSFGPNADEIMTDVPNYTNIEPQVMISEVII